MVRVSPEHRLACHVYAATTTRSPPSPSLLPPSPPPPLLLLRGFGMTKEDSHQLAAALAARGQRVVTFDYRALGESEAPSRRLDGWRLPDLARDCAGLMRGLGFAADEGAEGGGSGYSVLGASMGGYIAQHLALAAAVGATGGGGSIPLRKLVLACTHHGGPLCEPPTPEYYALVAETAPPPLDAPKASPEWTAWRAQMRRLFAVNFSREFAGRGGCVERAGLGFEALLDQFCACAVRDAAADAGEHARAAAMGLDARALQAAAI